MSFRRLFTPPLLLLAALPAGAVAQTKITGGTTAAQGQVPYQAYIDIQAGQAFCGGTILDATHVATAAHCVVDPESDVYPFIQPPGDFTVWVGASGGTGVNRPGGAAGDNMSSRTVTRVQVDPRYQRRLGGDEFDAAILTVSTSMLTAANTAALVPATAAELESAFVDDTSQHLISGWGDTSFGGSPSDVLLFATVPLVPDDECDDEYDPGTEFNASAMVCAGDPP